MTSVLQSGASTHVVSSIPKIYEFPVKIWIPNPNPDPELRGALIFGSCLPQPATEWDRVRFMVTTYSDKINGSLLKISIKHNTSDTPSTNNPQDVVYHVGATNLGNRENISFECLSDKPDPVVREMRRVLRLPNRLDDAEVWFLCIHSPEPRWNYDAFPIFEGRTIERLKPSLLSPTEPLRIVLECGYGIKAVFDDLLTELAMQTPRIQPSMNPDIQHRLRLWSRFSWDSLLQQEFTHNNSINNHYHRLSAPKYATKVLDGRNNGVNERNHIFENVTQAICKAQAADNVRAAIVHRGHLRTITVSGFDCPHFIGFIQVDNDTSLITKGGARIEIDLGQGYGAINAQIMRHQGLINPGELQVTL